MGKFDNEILAVPAERVKHITQTALSNNGFMPFNTPDAYLSVLRKCVTKPRGQLEEDPAYKQLIPYLVLTYKNEIFYYVRPSGINEQRLANKVSIGVGGHVELEDVAHADETILTAAKREAQEEIGENLHLQAITPLGFIYTEQSEVDRVHMGILLVGQLKSDQLQVKVDEVGSHGFSSRKELALMGQDGNFTLENWTKISLMALAAQPK